MGTRTIWKPEPIAVPSRRIQAATAKEATSHLAKGPEVRFGLRANMGQFGLLMLINAFVGGMVGIERTVVPLIGSEEFGIASTTLIVSFIVSFGVVKAFANLVSGHLADTWGRKRVLVLGWLFGLPVPFMIIWAPNWEWVIAANALLGINQGLRLVDDSDHEGRSCRAEVARPRRRPQRVRRLSRGRRDGLPHRLSRVAIRAAPGADLSRHWLCGPGYRSLDPARARHARSRPAGDLGASHSKPLRSASGRSFHSRPSETAICSPPHRRASSTISTTA